MKRWVLAATLVCAVAAVRAGDAAPAVQVVTLKNGLRVLLAPDTSATAVNLGLWYEVGLRDEPEGRTGLSRLVENLRARGAFHAGSGDFNRAIQDQGGVASAYSTPDLSCFDETLPADALERGFQAEAARMATPGFSGEDLEAVRKAAHDERRRGLDQNPLGHGLERLYATAYAPHPYQSPVLGRHEDLDRITLAEADGFYRARYVPASTVVAVVGDFDPAAALRYARQYLEPLPRAKATSPRTAPPPQKIERRAFDTFDAEVPLVLVGWRAPADADPDSPALDVLSQVIAGGGPNSRLSRALIGEKNLCVFTTAGLDSRKDAGLFYAVGAARPDADSAAVERELIGALESLATEPLDSGALEKVKHQIEASTLFGWQTARGRGQALGAALVLDGDAGAAAARLDRVTHLTPADVQRAAARVFQPAGRTVVWLKPSGHAAEGGAR